MARPGFQPLVATLIAQTCPSAGVSLDLGSGKGAYHDSYRNRVVGVELTARARETPGSVQARMEQLPFRDASVDYLTCFQALYYVGDLTATLGEIRRVARRGAQGLVSVSRPRAIVRVEPRAAGLQRHHAGGWLERFAAAGIGARRLYPSLGGGLVPTLASRVHAILSPYLWFRLSFKETPG